MDPSLVSADSFGINVRKDNGTTSLNSELFFAGNFKSGGSTKHQVRINGNDLYIRNHLNLGNTFGYSSVTSGQASAFNYQSIFLWTGGSTQSITLNNSSGTEGQIITFVDCDASNNNLTIYNICQYNAGSLYNTTTNHLEMTDGGASVSVIKTNGKWFFLGRSGNVNWHKD